MKNYVSPTMTITEEMAEGIFTASGDTTDKGSCGSNHMHGSCHRPNHGGYTNMEYYGCTGCLAYSSGSCNVGSCDKPQNSCRPTWEQHGWGAHSQHGCV